MPSSHRAIRASQEYEEEGYSALVSDGEGSLAHLIFVLFFHTHTFWWWRVLGGLSNRWPTRSDIEQCNITEMESSEVMPCITKPKTQVPSQADAGLGGRNKNMCSQGMKYVFLSTYPIKYQRDMSCGRPWCWPVEVPGWGWGHLWMAGLGQPRGQTILCKPTPNMQPCPIRGGASSPFQTLPNILFKLSRGSSSPTNQPTKEASKAQPPVIWIVKCQPTQKSIKHENKIDKWIKQCWSSKG